MENKRTTEPFSHAAGGGDGVSSVAAALPGLLAPLEGDRPTWLRAKHHAELGECRGRGGAATLELTIAIATEALLQLLGLGPQSRSVPVSSPHGHTSPPPACAHAQATRWATWRR